MILSTLTYLLQSICLFLHTSHHSPILLLQLSLWALSRLVKLWAYPEENLDCVSIMEELQVLGSSGLIAHLIVGYPKQFVETVFIPIIKSLTCYHPVQFLLKSICYQDRGSADSMGRVIEYISTHVFASAGLTMGDIPEGTANSTAIPSRHRLHGRAAGSGDDDDDAPSEVSEYMYYYIQHHRKAAVDQLLVEHEKLFTQNNGYLSDNSRIDADQQVVWFRPLEALADKEPAVLFRILMSENVQR